ncbi:MAG: hypothetical protein ACXVW7_20430, partial [Trebonia sp.]
QAALRESTGNFEMSVFHTLSAGNIGQPGAPGTVVPAAAGAADATRAADAVGVAAVLRRTARRTVWLLAEPTPAVAAPAVAVTLAGWPEA